MAKKAVVLMSGGLDSALAAAYLKKQGFSVYGVFVNRGQTNFASELKAVQKIAAYLTVPVYNSTFSLPDLRSLSFEERKTVGIPARNLILSSLALPYLYVLGSSLLVLGNLFSDHMPDCSLAFRKKFSVASSQALDIAVEVVAPFADWEGYDKSGEIRWAFEKGFSELFPITWTCWGDGEFHCGRCGACKGRKAGFVGARVTDPTVYEGVSV
ncbi:7-cyano-7-deazaguanine synthase [Candidatus Giovannonibacteria bacterium]|nr:7-cyano-7-deazaguanine synthase [Candidatus Giovannonibacteria bacterium]